MKNLEYPKTINKLVEKIRNFIKSSVPNLYLFTYDFYYSLSEEERNKKLENWNRLMEETEDIMKHWKEIKESDPITTLAKLMKADRTDDHPRLYSLIKKVNQRILDACEVVSRITEIRS